MHKRNQVFSTKITEGMERPSVMVSILEGANPQFRCYEWGTSPDGNTFFSLTNGSRVEIVGKPHYMIQIPQPNFTIDEEGRHRELRKQESVILQ
jgi:hypothetical protein